MYSADWLHYPKGADFPRVAECPDCHGTGLRIDKLWRPSIDDFRTGYRSSGFYYECPRCTGSGKIIPPEWLDASG